MAEKKSNKKNKFDDYELEVIEKQNEIYKNCKKEVEAIKKAKENYDSVIDDIKGKISGKKKEIKRIEKKIEEAADDDKGKLEEKLEKKQQELIELKSSKEKMIDGFEKLYGGKLRNSKAHMKQAMKKIKKIPKMKNLLDYAFHESMVNKKKEAEKIVPELEKDKDGLQKLGEFVNDEPLRGRMVSELLEQKKNMIDKTVNLEFDEGAKDYTLEQLKEMQQKFIKNGQNEFAGKAKDAINKIEKDYNAKKKEVMDYIKRNGRYEITDEQLDKAMENMKSQKSKDEDGKSISMNTIISNTVRAKDKEIKKNKQTIEKYGTMLAKRKEERLAQRDQAQQKIYESKYEGIHAKENDEYDNMGFLEKYNYKKANGIVWYKALFGGRKEAIQNASKKKAMSVAESQINGEIYQKKYNIKKSYANNKFEEKLKANVSIQDVLEKMDKKKAKEYGIDEKSKEEESR